MGGDLATPEFRAARRRLEARFDALLVADWWADLPATLAAFTERWDLELGSPVGHGETAVVIPAVRGDHERVFLKLTPEPELSVLEDRALERWIGTGRVPRVLDHSTPVGVLLLEALPTDRPLRLTGAVPSLEAVAELFQALQVRVIHTADFPPLAKRVDFLFDRWEQRLADDHTLAPVVGLERLAPGRLLAQELAAAYPSPSLVHGDLHPGNVFDPGSRAGLMTLDPRPCVGDPAFDLIDWILWQTDLPDEWRLRTNALVKLTGIEAERAWAWCQSFAALLAALELARGGSASRVAALLSIAP